MNKGLLRKQKSLEIIKSQGISYFEHLSVLENEDEIKLKSVDEIIERIYAFALVAGYGSGIADKEVLIGFKKTYNYSFIR